MRTVQFSTYFPVREDLKGSPMGLYDSDTGDSVIADKVVDVSSFCPDSAECVIKYANVKKGRIAQICDHYAKGDTLGTTVHYNISEMTAEQLAADVVFRRRCSVMGAPFSLAQIIFINQETTSEMTSTTTINSFDAEPVFLTTLRRDAKRMIDKGFQPAFCFVSKPHALLMSNESGVGLLKGTKTSTYAIQCAYPPDLFSSSLLIGYNLNREYVACFIDNEPTEIKALPTEATEQILKKISEYFPNA